MTLAFVNEPKERLGADGGVASLTVVAGEAARFVSVRLEEAFSGACHVCAAAVLGAVAPLPPPAVEPYVIANVDPPDSVRLETVIVWPEADSEPALAVV